MEMQGAQSRLGNQLNESTRNLWEAQMAVTTELREAVSDINQNQEFIMTEIGLLQRNMEDIQIQLSSLATRLAECLSPVSNLPSPIPNYTRPIDA